MKLSYHIRSLWLAILLTLAFHFSAEAREDDLHPKFDWRFERHVYGTNFSSYYLFLANPGPKIKVTATLYLTQEKTTIARIPLRNLEVKDAKTPISFAAWCLTKQFLDQYSKESYLRVDLRKPGDITEAKFESYIFQLSEAKDQPEAKGKSGAAK